MNELPGSSARLQTFGSDDQEQSNPGSCQRCVARRAFLTAISCAMLIAAGCSGEAERKVALRRSNLTESGRAYREFFAEHDRAPADAAELIESMLDRSDDAAVADAITSLRDGDIVMLWNGRLDAAEVDGNTTLGFEAAVPGSGGYVVTADGTIRLITSSQFASTPTVPTQP